MRKNILVAPLNWGLGHATRCIPIIKELEKNGYCPILASDGGALLLLQKEFPHLTALELPSYQIEYAKKGFFFKWKLIKNSPKTIGAILNEKRLVRKWVKEYQLSGIISDNRLGVFSNKIPSVFMTHQLKVLSGNTTQISSKLHQFFIRKFDQCWIPDTKDFTNFSGKLGHLTQTKLNLKYIGVVSRLEKKELPIKYDLMVLLSGPEPQRTLLEEKLTTELIHYKKKVIFIKGKVAPEQIVEEKENILFYNFMQSKELEEAFNQSNLILCRSGYTTVMDLVKLEKKAFFIPTPGQFEQEYLAKKYDQEGLIPYCKQNKFTLNYLEKIAFYKGFPQCNDEMNWKELFALFQSK